MSEMNNFPENKIQRTNEKDLLMCMIIWSIVYCTYKKFLNRHLRDLGFGLIRRNRVSNVLWNCVFTIIILNTTFFWESFLKTELSVIILKSYYVHYIMLLVFVNNWLKGISNFSFMLFMFGTNWPRLQPSITRIFLFKSIDMLVLEFCRMLYLKWPKRIKQIYTKSLHVIYCVFWVYLYMIYIPINFLLFYECQFLHEKIVLYLWTFTQYLNFISCTLKRNYKRGKLLEQFLFPALSTESIHLNKIFNDYKKIENIKAGDRSLGKKELWQTLLCAMAIKKKINRMRKSKQMESKFLTEKESTRRKKD